MKILISFLLGVLAHRYFGTDGQGWSILEAIVTSEVFLDASIMTAFVAVMVLPPFLAGKKM